MSTKDALLVILTGVGTFLGSLLLLIPLSNLLVAWLHDPPPDAPHGGGYVFAAMMGIGIILDILVAAVIGGIVAFRLQRKWSSPDAKP